MHNEEDAASQACRWRVRRPSLQVVYYRGRVPPPQQTLWTRLPGDRSWSYNAPWYSGSLRWVREVQRTYRLVWDSSFFIFISSEKSIIMIGFGRPWIAVCIRLTSCFLQWRTVTKERWLSMTSTVQLVALWLPGRAITLRGGNQTSSLLGYVRCPIDNFRPLRRGFRNLNVSVIMQGLTRDPSPISTWRKETLLVRNMCVTPWQITGDLIA